MSDFTHQVNTAAKFNKLVKNEEDKDINKVLLFTKKEKVTPVFKALSAEFRDRLRFYVIPILDKKTPQDLLDIYNRYDAKELPAIIVEQTFNIQENEVLDEVINVNYGKVSSDLPQLMKFMRTIARKIPKEELKESQ
jgi:hypothetical protein